MGSLRGKSPKDTYKSLLKVADETNGVSTSLSQIEDGEGAASCLSISDDQIIIQPQNDNTTSTVRIINSSGTRILQADTSNSKIQIGETLTAANTQLLEFHAKTLVPGSAGTHYFVGRPMTSYSLSAVEQACGTGTDPDTTLDAGAATDDLLQNLFRVPINLTVDEVKFIVSTTTDTDTTINVHLYSFDMVNSGGTNDGNLSNGTLLADGQATSVDRNVIKTVTCSISSASVTSGKVIACFVENETNTDSIMLQTQVLYHFD
jgi:hypothetical protein